MEGIVCRYFIYGNYNVLYYMKITNIWDNIRGLTCTNSSILFPVHYILPYMKYLPLSKETAYQRIVRL